MRESDLIKMISSHFIRSSQQINKPFESDSEIIRLGSDIMAVTMDEFSDEDGFGDMSAEMLGHNMAVAVLSDLFASGAVPGFYIHCLIVPGSESGCFIRDVCRGVSSVLKQANCFLIGGDVGSGDSWRYCATAIGSIENSRYITRIMPSVEQDLWVTGDIGDANYAGLAQKSCPVFELRLKEAEYIRKNALACIDTSGGFADAVWMLWENNTSMNIEVDFASLPFCREVIENFSGNNVLLGGMLYGGAGEYELLFTLPAGEVPDINAVKVGRVMPCKDNAGLAYNLNGRVIIVTEPPVCSRSTESRSVYIEKVIEQVQNVFSE